MMEPQNHGQSATFSNIPYFAMKVGQIIKTDTPQQTVQSKMKQLKQELFDQGMYCLPLLHNILHHQEVHDTLG